MLVSFWNVFLSLIFLSFPSADETLYYNVIAGVVAGAVSSAICNPTDLLKVNEWTLLLLKMNNN